MKLEAMNGNLLSLTMKVSSQEESKVEPQLVVEKEKADETEVEDQLQEEGDKEVGGKKKGARKKRSLNWEEAERGLLVEVIKPKVDYVENRNVDAKSIKAKRLAWMQITKQFNALNFRHRSLEQIQVQWRSMKNSAKREHIQKHPKSLPLEGVDMIEFMEEMQKDPVSARSQTRGGGISIKKEMLELDDEDTPLSALPTLTNTSEDTLQTSTIALPSPPPSAESQNEMQITPTRNKKKTVSQGATVLQKQQVVTASNSKSKKQRNQNSAQSDVVNAAATDSQSSQISLPTHLIPTTPPATDDKYRKQLFEVMKRARLTEMDFARREHEQKLRLEQMEKELKLNYYRQQEELRLHHMREEHEMRMRCYQTEHEARMHNYVLFMKTWKPSAKAENSDTNAACN